MVFQTLKCLASRLANFIDCLKDLQELEAMCVIIPAFESLETKIKKYQKLNELIIFNTMLFCVLESTLQAEYEESIERETVYIILREKHEAYHAATLESIKHFDEIIKKSLYRYRPRRAVSTLFE